MNKRITQWSSLKGALMIVVVMGHFCQLYAYRNAEGYLIASLFCLIYTFHMPLFCFVSGFFSKNLEKRRATAFTSLFLPYVEAQLVIGIITFVVDRNINIIKNPLYATYGTWYLIALYIWRICMPDLVKIKKLSVFAVLLFFMTPFFWGMDNTLGLPRVLGFFCFFLAGYMATEKDILKVVRIPKILCIVLFLVELVGLYVCFSVFDIPYVEVSRIFTHGLNVSQGLRQIPLIFGVYVIAFLLTVINSILFLNLFFRQSDALVRIGDDTMPLYLSHLALVKLFELIMRPFSNVIYIIFSVPVAFLLVYGMSSKRYRICFNQAMKKIESIFIC